WLVCLAYGQALFNHRLALASRLALATLALGWVFKALVFQTSWFSGWAPSLVALAVITFFRSRIAFTLATLLCVVGVAAAFDSVFDVVWGGAVRKGDLTRLDIWNQTLELVSRFPLFGTGPAGYAVYFQSLYAGSRFSLSTHNNYLDILAQTGVVGFVVFAWLFLALGLAGWQARRLWLAGFEGGYAQAVFAGFPCLVLALCPG